jgi:serine/threonine-protein kinase
VYVILAAIGAGGMGEVYRARDTRLDRIVAIKVLPAALAGDPEFRARFEREARSISALEHPHICPLYDVGEYEGTAFLVMQHLEGETLADRLARGPLPLDDALTVAMHIAAALDRAHHQGIVHRDLKPGNIFLALPSTPGPAPAADGTARMPRRRAASGAFTARLLDFGLAKQGGAGALALTAMSATAAAATVAAPLTARGTVLGTLQYMAPEQIDGDDADARTDIFALGVVLYEMLTGRKAFEGRSQASLLGAILKDQPPPISAVTTYGRPALDFAVARCLAKDPDDRWQSVRDLLGWLEWIAVNGDANAAVTPDPPARTRQRVQAGLLLAAAVAAAVAGTWLVLRPVPAPAPLPVRFTISPAPDAPVHRGVGAGVALSPQGSVIVYVARPAGQGAAHLYRRELDGGAPVAIRGTEGAFAPFFSPDGAWIGFFTDEYVMKVPAAGGPATPICPKGIHSRAAWGPGDMIFLGTSAASGPGPLHRVPASGGTPAPMTSLGDGERLHQFPRLLPDGRHLLFTVIGSGRLQTAVTTTDGGEHRVLFDGSDARFVPPGHLVYGRGEELFAVPFDAAGVAVTGPPFPVLPEGATVRSGAITVALLDTDNHGNVAYAKQLSAETELAWMDASGRRVPVPLPRSDYDAPRLAPDGERLAVTMPDPAGYRSLWVMDLARGTRLRLTAAAAESPVWMSEGRQIAFRRGGHVFRIAADASGTEERLLEGAGDQRYSPAAWSRDGASLLITIAALSRGTLDRHIGILVPGSPPKVLVGSAADETQPALSRDGQWMAYVSNASGRDEVYLRTLSGAGGTMPISNGGGTMPMWAADGRAIYFVERARLLRAAVPAPGRVEAPVAVAELPSNLEAIELAPDGRFLLLRRTGADADAVEVILNWGASLASKESGQ